MGYFQQRGRFSWGRGAVAAGGVAVLLLLLNARRSYEGIVLDDSPFADPWQSCERIEYGWPLAAWAVPTQPGCSILPDLDAALALFDLVAFGGCVSLIGFGTGAYERRVEAR